MWLGDGFKDSVSEINPPRPKLGNDLLTLGAVRDQQR